ncbi:MAG: hypothetical protein HQM00_00510 [Magnetococcales bacterium]|nr:hypothetical protein [Magnetococcales bacterium]
MEGVHESWKDLPRSRTGVPQGSPESDEEQASDSPFAEEMTPSGRMPKLSPLSLDTVLTVEDLRRLLKIVVYS